MSGKHANKGIGASVRKALKSNPSASIPDLMAATGLSREQCTFHRWRLRHRERIREYQITYARTLGIKPRAAIIAAQQEQADRLVKPVVKLRRKGDSFSAVGAALGITRNAVAGRLWRAKRRAEAQGVQA